MNAYQSSRRPAWLERCLTALLLLFILPLLAQAQPGSVAPAAAQVGPALKLRLDTDLAPPKPAAGDLRTDELIRFGSSDVRRRANEYRSEMSAVQRENQLIADRISGNEKLIERMKGLSGLQQRTLDVLKSTLGAQRAKDSAASSSPSASSPSAPRPQVPAPADVAPAGAPQVPANPVATLPVPVEPTPEAASVSIAGYELPYWLLAGVVGAILIVLLVWGWMRLATPRSIGEAKAPGSTLARVQAKAAAAAPAAKPLVDAPSVAASSEQSSAAVVEDEVDDFLQQLHSARARTDDSAQTPTQAGVVGSGNVREAFTDGNMQDIGREEGAQGGDTEVDWSRTMISSKAADPQALKEVDTLIAFEQFDKAKAVLDKMLESDPDNPEYMLRHYHVRTHAGTETNTDDAEILRAMMDGPMSDTMLRVREIGRGLMPGDPLFDDKQQRDEALQVLKRTGERPEPEAKPSAPGGAGEDDDEFEKTVLLDPKNFKPVDPDSRS